MFVTWALLLAIGLFGDSVGLPRRLTVPLGLVAVIALFWFMPGGYLYALIVERRRGALRSKGLGALAIRRRWYFAFVGGFVSLVGLILLVPTTQASTELRLAGAVIVVWGLLALAVAGLAFRT